MEDSDVATPRIRPYGPDAWYVTDLEDPAAWAMTMRHLDDPDVIDVVPGERAVVVITRRGGADRVRTLLDTAAARPATAPSVLVEIPVVYGGLDLGTVASSIGRSVRDVIEMHCAPLYEVAFCGFSPGFAYLVGLDQRLHLPRRSTPRVLVPVGSVAIAAHYTAVYPSASPGGWHLLGTTTERVWDADRAEPALLVPGTRVRFVPT